jgi:hypothetical protein
MALEAARQAVASGSHSPTRRQSNRPHRSSKMSEPNYQFRDYPRAIAERAWQRLTGHHQWMTLDRFTAILLKTANDEGHSRELVKAAVCSKAFCGPSGRRLVLFLLRPSPYSRRSEAWRVTAKDYADTAKRFATIDLLNWYLQSTWVPTRVVEDWCSKKGYEVRSHEPAAAAAKAQRTATPKELRGKPGPSDKHDWQAIKAAVFSLMNKYGEFSRDRGWYQAKLEDRALEDLNNPPDVSGLRRHLPAWLGEWRSTQKKLRT